MPVCLNLEIDSSQVVRKQKQADTVHGSSQKVTKKAKPDAKNPKNGTKKAGKGKRKGPSASSAPVNDEETGPDMVANNTLTKIRIPEAFVGKKDYLWAKNSLATFSRFQGGVRWLNVVQAWFFLEDSRNWRKPGSCSCTTTTLTLGDYGSNKPRSLGVLVCRQWRNTSRTFGFGKAGCSQNGGWETLTSKKMRHLLRT